MLVTWASHLLWPGLDDLHCPICKGYGLGVFNERQFNGPSRIGVQYLLLLQERMPFHCPTESLAHCALKSTVRRSTRSRNRWHKPNSIIT